MTPMLSPQNCIFTNSLICLVIPIRDLNTKKEKQEQVCKFDRKPWYHVRILIYQTIEIDHMTLLEYRNIIMLFLVLILRHKLKIKGRSRHQCVQIKTSVLQLETLIEGYPQIIGF